MPNKTEMLENELNRRRESMDRIQHSISTGRTNSDGDLVLPEEQVTLINRLLDEV